MIFALILATFLAAMLLTWLLCFPDARDAAFGWLSRRARAAGHRLLHIRKKSRHALHSSTGAVRQNTSLFGKDLFRHRYVLIGIVVLLSVPPLLVVGMRHHVQLEGFGNGEEDRGGNTALVASLLRGEQLRILVGPVATGKNSTTTSNNACWRYIKS
jgi:peptidoglycan L-alanyl-D-glutamate endopeptidase CwlK